MPTTVPIEDLGYVYESGNIDILAADVETGDGPTINLRGASTTDATGAGGASSLRGGDAIGGAGGGTALYGGSSETGNGGEALVQGGAGNNGGNVLVVAGAGDDGEGGSVGISAGTGSNVGGAVTIEGGLGLAAADGGNLTLKPGISSGAGDNGQVLMPILPTANPNIAGALWNDGGTLKVSAG